jgi:ABC-type sugar transport system ATPase subunit
VPGEVVDGSVHLLGGSLPLGPAITTAIERAGKRPPYSLIVGCRPEHIVLQPGHDPGGINGTVATCEDNGAETILSIDFGPEYVPIGERPFYVRLLSFLQLQPGSPAHLTLDPNKFVLFDPDTALRLAGNA